MTDDQWKELHDATLESIELRWSSGEATLRVRTGSTLQPRRVVVASAVRRLSCDRQMPWGLSVSIHQVHGPRTLGESSEIEIEMQSGDLIRIEAGAFRIDDAE